MILSPRVVLKVGKDKPVRQRHPWIFSGAIHKMAKCDNGELLPVYSADGILLGTGYFNQGTSLTGRMISFGNVEPLQALEERLESALKFRRSWFDLQHTNAYRLINGEGDGIPGLIIDIYDQVVVFQSSTHGIDRLKPWIVDWLKLRLQPHVIYEKSISTSRKTEGLTDQQGILCGSTPQEIAFKENDLNFTSSLETSQKTGFFLDQREMRLWIRQLSHNKRVLNAFAYTGAFTVYALAGQAKMVDSVEISPEAIEHARRHVVNNGFENTEHTFFCEDVFSFLRQRELPYDIVILDPPAFAKKPKDVIAACRGYKDINRLAMQKMPSQSLLMTSSCSYYVNEDLFQKVLFQSALEAGRQIRIIGKHRLAPDHPINLFHPESQYLKSFLLFVE